MPSESSRKIAALVATGATLGAATIDYLTLKGTYQYPLILGTARIWQNSATSRIYIKHGSNPTSVTDGNYINVT